MKFRVCTFINNLSLIDIVVLAYIVFLTFDTLIYYESIGEQFNSLYSTNNNILRFILILYFIFVFMKHSKINNIYLFKTKTITEMFNKSFIDNFKYNFISRFLLIEFTIFLFNFSYISNWLNFTTNLIMFFIYCVVLCLILTKLSFVFNTIIITSIVILAHFGLYILSLPLFDLKFSIFNIISNNNILFFLIYIIFILLIIMNIVKVKINEIF